MSHKNRIFEKTKTKTSAVNTRNKGMEWAERTARQKNENRAL